MNIINIKFSLSEVADSLLTLTLFSGLTACVVYKDSPEVVLLASSGAFSALLLQKAFAWTIKAKQSSLNYAESVELSFLRQIRFKLKNNQDISAEHIAISEDATEDSDKAYSDFFGFGRPLPAVAVKNSRKLTKAVMKRSSLIETFKKIGAPESEWALETLSKCTNEDLSTDDLKSVADCLCKINDHASGDESWYNQSEALESEFCRVLYPLAKKTT